MQTSVGDHPTYQRHQERGYFAVVQNSGTSMGVSSSLYMHFAQVEQVGPDQPGVHHLPWLR